MAGPKTLEDEAVEASRKRRAEKQEGATQPEPTAPEDVVAPPGEHEVEQARRVLMEQTAAREQACTDGVRSILEEFGCGIATKVDVSDDGRLFARWRIQAIN